MKLNATAFKLSLLAALGIALANAQAADQPQWGEKFTRNMVSSERGLPRSFDIETGRNIAWKAALGSESHATAVVGSGKILIGTNNQQPRDPRHQGDRSILLCFDEKTGEFLWQLVVPKLTNSIYCDWPKAGICSAPTIEGDRAYLVSNRGEVLCVDLNGQADGNALPYTNEARHAVPAGEEPIVLSKNDADIVWLFDIIKECGVRQHDQACASILIDGPFLYLNTSNGVDDTHKQIHAPNAPSLIVIDKATGRLLARDDEHIGPRIFHCTWSPPLLASIEGKPRIIFAGGDGVIYGFEPLKTAPPIGEVAALKKVWQFDPDPTGPKENVHRFNGNRKTSPSNIKSTPVFLDNRIYVTVGGDLWWGKNEAWLQCIDARGEGDVTGKNLVWSLPIDKHSMSTPAVWNGMVFVADCGRKIYCADAATGKVCWTHETKSDIWGSTLVADGKVFVGSNGGEFFVFNAAREKNVLFSAELDSPIHSTPIAANGTLYVSTMNWLYAIRDMK